MKEAVNFVNQIREEVINLAKEHPEAVYQNAVEGDTCSYIDGHVWDSKNQVKVGDGCIVGQAIRRINPELEKVLSREDVVNDAYYRAISECVLEMFDLELDDIICQSGHHDDDDDEVTGEDLIKLQNTLDIIAEMQRLQDINQSWGYALEETQDLMRKRWGKIC